MSWMGRGSLRLIMRLRLLRSLSRSAFSYPLNCSGPQKADEKRSSTATSYAPCAPSTRATSHASPRTKSVSKSSRQHNGPSYAPSISLSPCLCQAHTSLNSALPRFRSARLYLMSGCGRLLLRMCGGSWGVLCAVRLTLFSRPCSAALFMFVLMLA